MSDMNEDERAYYREYHGFDPVANKVLLDLAGARFRYQAEFALEKDPHLHAAGVTLLARVDVDTAQPPNEGGIRNWLLFRRGVQEAGYECKHTVVCTVAPDAPVDTSGDAALPLLDIARSQERPKINLPPEEHFAAMLAFAREFAAEGLEHMTRRALLSEQLRPDRLPIGFTGKMQKALFGALWQIAPVVTRGILGNLILEVADALPPAVFDPLLPLLDDIYNLSTGVLQDTNYARLVASETQNKKLKALAQQVLPQKNVGERDKGRLGIIAPAGGIPPAP